MPFASAPTFTTNNRASSTPIRMMIYDQSTLDYWECLIDKYGPEIVLK